MSEYQRYLDYRHCASTAFIAINVGAGLYRVFDEDAFLVASWLGRTPKNINRHWTVDLNLTNIFFILRRTRLQGIVTLEG